MSCLVALLNCRGINFVLLENVFPGPLIPRLDVPEGFLGLFQISCANIDADSEQRLLEM